MTRRTESPKRGIDVINPDGHVIGLDIGATAVRAAILSPASEPGQRFMVSQGMGESPLPLGTVVNGVLEDTATLSKVLRDMWRSYDFGCKQVVVGVSHQQTTVRTMQMPRLSPEQMAQALPFQVREIIALPVDEALLDFQPLDANDDQAMVDGLLMVAPRAPVVRIVHAVEAAGLQVARVDLASFAALRATGSFGHEAEAVIDLGAQTTDIVIHKHGIPRVVRTIVRGGQQVTDRLADRLGVGLLEAEQIKCENGLNGSDAAANRIIGEAIRPLIADIRSSIQYFNTTNAATSPRRISLTGGAAELPGFAESLASDVGLETAIASPLQHVRPRSAPRHLQTGRPDGVASAVAVGLALGAAA